MSEEKPIPTLLFFVSSLYALDGVLTHHDIAKTLKLDQSFHSTIVLCTKTFLHTAGHRRAGGIHNGFHKRRPNCAIQSYHNAIDVTAIVGTSNALLPPRHTLEC